MYIIDQDGKQIRVTDLDAAISQADWYRNAKHENPGFEALDKYLNRYWQDVYEKLIRLKER